MTYAIKVENLSKRYLIRLGNPAGSLKELVEHYRRKFFYKIIPKFKTLGPDPYEVSIEEFVNNKILITIQASSTET